MSTHYIEKSTGNICDMNHIQIPYIANNIVYLCAEGFYHTNGQPNLEHNCWLSIFGAEDIEYLIEYFEKKDIKSESEKEKIADLKENYKKYQKLSLIKSIIE